MLESPLADVGCEDPNGLDRIC